MIAKAENRVYYSIEFETWVVQLNLSEFAFVSKSAAQEFLDAFENGRIRVCDDDTVEIVIDEKFTS